MEVNRTIPPAGRKSVARLPLDASKKVPRLARFARTLRHSALQGIHDLIARPGLLSFALGQPSTELLPAGLFRQTLGPSLEGATFQYSRAFRPLQRHVVELMARRGVACREDQVFLCNGAQQGLHLLARLLVDPGDPVVVEELTYEGCLNAVSAVTPRILAVPTNPQEGMDLDALETILRSGVRPAFVYAMPDGHNPMGTSLGPADRRRLVGLAQRYETPIIEDDAYGLLSYSGEATPALRALDEDWVFYVGSLSKVLAPSLRLGWVVVPESIGRTLSQLKHGCDLHVLNFAWQAAVYFFDGGHFPGHLDTVRGEYRRRRDTMLAALAEHFPPTARWVSPPCGLYLWVELGGGIDTVDLLRRSVEEAGVAFCPGSIFQAGEGWGGSSSLRLCFGNASPEEIERGIAALGQLLSN